MKNLIFIVGLIASIIALTAISVTAINETEYYKLFIVAIVCSMISISTCLFFYSGGGWSRYISFLFLANGIYSIYNVICRYFG
ncbi:hypothetical protein CIT292_08888 [Citrobacter youngae ATCC 29220]|uniref:Uncharacterized protein n=1 Tax=Citrobacter youngae ATCC 29220 TaxID=500640 RepID=D4BEF5_9ENTR|nr:hypothetical protein CIT292_08888 [Citrobacter youngae ATCC 29220]